MASLRFMIPQKVIYYIQKGIVWKDKDGQVVENPNKRQKIRHLLNRCREDAPPNEHLHFVSQLVATFIRIGQPYPEWEEIAKDVFDEIVNLQLQLHQVGLHDHFVYLPTSCMGLIADAIQANLRLA